ncbi:hypothetical protein [Staphylococcus pseudoxylosus]|uniref:hypothetical protein n=1 Tax=Staphylococcus pseudoxylosus TaxID=2282419 RepID=UPI003F552822
MKRILFVSLINFLILAACGNASNSESTSKQEASNLSDEKQEEKYKKETKKLGEILAEAGKGVNEGISDDTSDDDSDISEKDIKKLQKEIKKYRDNTKHLDKVNKEIGDYAYKTADSMMLYVERTSELEKFKKINPELEDAYDLANADAVYSLLTVFESIQMDYEDFDIDYKKKYLGAKGNEGITDILALQQEVDITQLADGLGVGISEFQDNLNSSQTKELSNKEYRNKVNKNLVHEEPDMSKRQYNAIVKDFNEKAPKFLHYDEVNKMISTTEYNYMIDLRNGVVGAETNSEIDDTDFSSESDSSEENVTRNNVIDYVEEYEGEPLDTEIYTYKEPEKNEDGEWGFSFTDKDGELAGSYIVDKNGNVTKYDEDGGEE